MSRMRFGTSLVGLSLLVLCLGSAGCKNRNKTLAPVTVGGDVVTTNVEGDARSAKVWDQVERLVLGDGLLVHWLPEAEAARLHLRLLIPTESGRTPLPAAQLNILANAMREQLALRTRGLHVRVSVHPAPGRIEVSLRGDTKDTERIFGALGRAMGSEPGTKVFEGLLTRELADHKRLDAGEAASSALLSTLLELPREHLASSSAEVQALSANELRKSWRAFVNPREAVLVVHGEGTPASAEPALNKLSDAWRAPGPSLSAPSESALERLQPHRARTARRKPKSHEDHLILGQPAAPLGFVDALELKPNRAIVAIGRVIPTPTAKERALARLAQRLIAQDADLRLVVAGPISVLILRARVAGSDPEASLAKAVSKLESYATSTFAANRIQQAARLWLGARVVAAALEDEDWTMLYSEALDLADSDEDATHSLARDALFMLEVQPDELTAFTSKWFAPKSGEPGWAWRIAGADENMATKLAALR